MVFTTLLWASAQPVFKIVILCSTGAFCAHKGLLTHEGRKVVSGLAYLLFGPSLNFVNLAGSLTAQRLLHWWPLVVNMAFSIGIGFLLGLAQNTLLKTERRLRPHVILATAFGNTGNLPLVIVATLALPSSGVVLRGVPAMQAEDLAIAYVVVGVLLPVIMQVTLGYHMLEPQASSLPRQGRKASLTCSDSGGAAVDAEALVDLSPATSLNPGGWARTPCTARLRPATPDSAGLLPSCTASGGAHALEGALKPPAGVPRPVQPPSLHGKMSLLRWLPSRLQERICGGTVWGLGGLRREGDELRMAVCSQLHKDAFRSDLSLAYLGSRTGGPPPALHAIGEPPTYSEATGPAPPPTPAGPSTAQASLHSRHQGLRPGQFPQGSEGGDVEDAAADGVGTARRLPLPPSADGGAREPGPGHGVPPRTSVGGVWRVPSPFAAAAPGPTPSSPPAAPSPPRRTATFDDIELGSGGAKSKEQQPLLVHGAPLTQEPAHAPPPQPGEEARPGALPPRGAWSRGTSWARGLLRGASQRGGHVAGRVLRECLSPPIIAILVALPIGAIRPLQAALFGSAAPLGLLTECLRMLSDCCIPCMMLALGATLSKGPGKALVPLRTIVSISVMRLLVLPAVGTLLVMGSYRCRLFHAADEIMLLVLLIQNTCPTAINVQTMAMVQDNGHEEVATILFWQYLASVFTVPAFLVLFLWLVDQSYRGPL